MSPWPQIYTSRWRTWCKSCWKPGGGGDGDMPGWLVPLTCVVLFGAPLLLWMVNIFTTQGIKASVTSCHWDSDRRTYVATVAIENMEDVFKGATFRVQFHFRPRPDQTWPHEELKWHYESISTTTSAVLRPNAQHVQRRVSFSIPVKGFLCSANVSLNKQERFQQPPSDEVLQALGYPTSEEGSSSRVLMDQ